MENGGTILILASDIPPSILRRLVLTTLGEVWGVVLDYLGRCARFNIHSYATRYIRNSPEGLSPLQKDQVRRCVVYARGVLDWALNLSPIQKDRFRYVSESAGIMISFCCLFIIASCQTFTSSIPNVFESLDKVVAAAQLTMDLAPDVDHNKHIQGSLILRRAEALRAVLKQRRTYESSGASFASPIETSIQPPDLARQEYIPGGLDLDLDVDGIAAMEPFWDFPILMARPW
jgi:hypothetical protein